MDVSYYCENCGEELSFDSVMVASYSSISVTIKPCEKCVKEGYDASQTELKE